MATEIEQMVYGFISSHFGVPPSDLNAETVLKDDLEADSLDLVEMTIRAEEKFDIIIDDDELGNLNTISDVIALIERSAGGARSTGSAEP